MRLDALSGALVLLLLATVGCANFLAKESTHLLFGQRTVVGVDVSPAVESGNVHLVLGYKRRTAAFVPTAEVATGASEETERQAMSVLAYTRVGVHWWYLPEIAECFATGDAAVDIAATPDAVNALRCEWPPADEPADRHSTNSEGETR